MTLTRAEAGVRRVLRVPEGPPTASQEAAHRLFSASVAVSAVRCLLSYVILPIVAPLIGSAVGDSPGVGIPLGAVALFFDVKALRRFWLADHPWRWKITVLYLVVMAMIIALLARDFLRLAS